MVQKSLEHIRKFIDESKKDKSDLFENIPDELEQFEVAYQSFANLEDINKKLDSIRESSFKTEMYTRKMCEFLETIIKKLDNNV